MREFDIKRYAALHGIELQQHTTDEEDDRRMNNTEEDAHRLQAVLQAPRSRGLIVFSATPDETPPPLLVSSSASGIMHCGVLHGCTGPRATQDLPGCVP